jgi:hypothetical protein
MTIGVKIVQFTVGDATISFDMQDFTPHGVLFFGGFADSAGGSRFHGAADGTNQWATASYTRANMSSRFSPTTGRQGYNARNDRCIHILKVTGTSTFTVAIDTSAHVTSFAANTINLSWNVIGAAAGTKMTAVVFYGDMFQCTAGVAGVSAAGTLTNIGYQPNAVLMSTLFNTTDNSVAFGTSAPTQDHGIFQGISFGWATFPEPDFQLVSPHSAGTTNTTQFGQQEFIFFDESLTAIGNETGFYDQHTPSPKGANDTICKQNSNGFTLVDTLGTRTNCVGYFAIQWTAGRFMSGYMTPTSGSAGESFTKWGGTYNNSGTDTDPTNHAQPSFMLLEGGPAGTTGYAGLNSHTYSVAAIDLTTVSGTAFAGRPDGAPSLPMSPASTEIATYFSSKFTLLAKDGSTFLQMALTSFDDDGITVTYPVVPAAGTYKWPYLVMGQDTGTLKNALNTGAMTEPPDVVAGVFIATIVGIRGQQNPTLTEAQDVVAGSMVTVVTFHGSPTEANDTIQGYFAGTNNNPAYLPGEVNYIPPENKSFRAEVRQLPFVNEERINFFIGFEERLFVVPGETRYLYAPPVEKGPWV